MINGYIAKWLNGCGEADVFPLEVELKNYKL